MRITYKGDYALKVILDLALNYGEEPTTIQDMAERLDIPVKFLEQVLLELKRAGFLESKRGKVGGYLLSKHPSQIKLGEVIRFVDGPIEPIACIDNKYKGCNDIYKCVFRKIWQDVTKATSGIIDKITFEDLVNQIKRQKDTVVYQI